MFVFIIIYLILFVFFFNKLVFKFEEKKGDSFGGFRRTNKFWLYEYNIYLYFYLIFALIIYFFFFFILLVDVYHLVFFKKLFLNLNIIYLLYFLLFFETLLAYCYHTVQMNKNYNISLISWNGLFYIFKCLIFIILKEPFVLFFLYTVFLIFLFGFIKSTKADIFNIKIK